MKASERLFIVLTLGLTAHAAFAQETTTNPQWLRRPSASQFGTVFPTGFAGSGSAQMKCIVTTTGRMRDCTVTFEDPPGRGIGERFLKLAPYFQMTPVLKDGVAIESSVTIPFRLIDEGEQVRRVVHLLDAPWVSAPTHDDIAAAFPKGRGEPVDGFVVLRCRITTKGGLTACELVSETPARRGFAEAARKLTKHFVGNAQVIAAASAQPTYADLKFAFPARMADPAVRVNGKAHIVTPPSLEQLAAVLPTGTDIFTMDGRAVVNCAIGAGGALTDCGIRSQEPASGGYGDAALALAPHFKMSAWSKDGLPVIGGRVSVPIAFKLSDEDRKAQEEAARKR